MAKHGTELPANLIVFAAGYGLVSNWAARLAGEPVPENLGEQPNRLRPRPPASSLNKTDQARRKRVKDADQKKTNGEENTRSLRPKKNTFGLLLTPWRRI